MNLRPPAVRFAALLCLAFAFVAPAFAGGRQLWTAKLPGDVKWHALTELGTLVVGTDDAILAYDPDSGAPLWTRHEFKKTSAFNSREIPGTPFLICHTSEGFAGLAKVTFHAVNYLDGRTLWQSAPVSGQYLGTIPVPSKNLAIFVLNGNGPDGRTPATWLYAHDLADGKQKWVLNFAKIGAIRLHVADNSGKFMPTTDLSGYHDPIVDGDNLYLPYLGCTCVDLGTGTIKWAAEMIKGGSEFKKAHAPLRIRDGRIYGSAGGSVYALDQATGKVLWQSERISSYAGLLKARDNAFVSQIEFVGGRLWARFGGFFSTGQAVVLREPLGIVALDPATGAAVYHFDEAKEGLTNLMVIPDTTIVMFADAANLYGIDTAGEKPTEAFRVPIEFKRKMGGGEIAQLGLGVLGGLRGLAKAAVAQNKARLDVPVAILRKGGHIIVQGKQHLLCFDPATRKIDWATYAAAPSDALGMTAMFAVTALVAVQGNALGMQGGVGSASYDQGVEMTHDALDRYNNAAGKRKSAAGNGDSYAFMLTRVEDGADKGVGLVGINLASGADDKKFVLGTKEPEYRVDDVIGRLFFFKSKNTIVAYQL